MTNAACPITPVAGLLHSPGSQYSLLCCFSVQLLVWTACLTGRVPTSLCALNRVSSKLGEKCSFTGLCLIRDSKYTEEHAWSKRCTTEDPRNVTGVKQMERSVIAAHCQDVERGTSGTLAASDWAIITTVVHKLRSAGNNLLQRKEISLGMEADVLMVELPSENKVTDSSLVVGVGTQHCGEYLTKAHTLKCSH